MSQQFVFGELLKKYRGWAGVSQVELAQRAGLGRNTISRWERSCYSPHNREIVLTVAEALCLYPNDLIATNELLQSAGFAPKPIEIELGSQLPVPKPSTSVPFMNQYPEDATDYLAWPQVMPLFTLDFGGFPNENISLFPQKSLLNPSKMTQQMTTKILSHLGDCFYESGQLDEATRYYRQALTTSRKIGDKCLESMQLNNLSIVFNQLGRLETAVEYCQKA